MKEKVDTGQGHATVTQNVGDLKAGIRYDDPSRISGYQGNKHVHTGADSPTFGTHGTDFNPPPPGGRR